MVRVLVVADEVVESIHDIGVRDLEPDLVLGAGDLPWEYLEFLASALEVPVVFVPGNHDPEVPHHVGGFRGLLAEHGFGEDPRPWGCINADDGIVDAAGLRIAGLGGSIRYNNGPNQYTQDEFDRRARRLRKLAGKRGGRVDILLTHSPPFGLGDETDRPHVGFEALHSVIDWMRPQYLLHGHIHPFGLARPDRIVGETVVRNVVPWRLLEVTPIDALTSMSHGS